VEEPVSAQAKEEAADSLRAGDVGAPAILGSFAPQKEKNGKVVTHWQALDEWP
jgi:hypothetical protein